MKWRLFGIAGFLALGACRAKSEAELLEERRCKWARQAASTRPVSVQEMRSLLHMADNIENRAARLLMVFDQNEHRGSYARWQLVWQHSQQLRREATPKRFPPLD